MVRGVLDDIRADIDVYDHVSMADDYARLTEKAEDSE
jgi:hypothetical protein